MTLLLKPRRLAPNTAKFPPHPSTRTPIRPMPHPSTYSAHTKRALKRRKSAYNREVRGKQEIECQGALFVPDGGLRVSLKGTERQRERETEGKIINH